MVYCTANDTFDGSYTTCCLSTIPSSMNTHTLSDVGKDAAVAHGQKISEYQLPDGITLLMEEDDTGLTHV